MDVPVKDAFGQSPFFRALQSGQQARMDPCSPKAPTSPLFLAVRLGLKNTVAHLIAKKADVNAKDK
jgi:hypothetical protein